MGFRRPFEYKFIACLFLGWAFLNFENPNSSTTYPPTLSRLTGEETGFCQNI